jgi:hypothetical protein
MTRQKWQRVETTPHGTFASVTIVEGTYVAKARVLTYRTSIREQIREASRLAEENLAAMVDADREEDAA